MFGKPSRIHKAALRFAAVAMLSSLAAVASTATPVAQPLAAFDPPNLYCPGTAPAVPCNLAGSSTENSITIILKGGGWGGAPNGFTVYYQTFADWQIYDFPWNSGATSPSLCSVSYDATYGVDTDVCTTVQIGNLPNPLPAGVTTTCGTAPLQCGTVYVIVAFAHAGVGMGMEMGASPYSDYITCSTVGCTGTGEAGCTYTIGYWKTHKDAWPAFTTLNLGACPYTKTQLCAILDTSPRGNGLISLAQQLIAAKLSILAGASDEDIASTIQTADSLIGMLKVPPVGTGSLAPAQTSGLVTTLTAYNDGTIGPGHCPP
jgi:hypothetical protein